jgi:hypothetical protein
MKMNKLIEEEMNWWRKKMKILMIRNKFGFYPAGDTDRRIYEKVSDGQVVMADFKKSRNLKHHRKFFAILKILCDNSEYKSIDDALTVVMFSIGHAEKIKTLTGQVIYCRKSIAFENMDQTEFEVLYNSACKVIADHLGISEDTLKGEAV